MNKFNNSKQEFDYQFEKLRHLKPVSDINIWDSRFGPIVLSRNEDGTAKKVKFSLLLENRFLRVFLVGKFNNWQRDIEKLQEFELIKDEYSVFATIELENVIQHKDEYKFLVYDGRYEWFMQDPAGHYFTDFGNTIFWDFEDPTSYIQQFDLINNFNRSTKIMQTDLPGLIAHFANKEGVCGQEIDEKKFYKFITQSGVVEKIKELGFNAIQFLPFAQSIDGSNWKFRYLVPFQYAIQKNWGTPDEFAQMIDEFHKHSISVIGDFVIGHFPDRNFKVFGQESDTNGVHLWKKSDGSFVYLKDETSWGSRRPDLDNPLVREFLYSSCLHFMKRYKIDGFRIDNVDGILRYGDTGEGDERPSGRVFLKELNSQIYAYNPSALIHYEAHYYYGDNSKMLVAPINSHKRALGATAYNSSRLTYYFHTQYMPKSIEEVSLWKFKHITDEMEWGKSNSTVADFHNHDAAAGLMEMRATGSYAYDAMMVKNPANHIHAVGKIKVMEAFISLCCEGRTLDLLQTFLLQSGTFEHDSSIQWYLTFNQANKHMVNFKKEVNNLMDNCAFWPENTYHRSYLNIDDRCKILAVERIGKNENEEEQRFVVIINFSAWKHHHYRVGVKTQNNYEVVFNSDLFEFSGMGIANYPSMLKNSPSTHFELLNREVMLDVVAPYGIVVLKEKK